MASFRNVSFPQGTTPDQTQGKRWFRLAYSVTLPFRLRLGQWYRFDDPDGSRALWVKNKYPIPAYDHEADQVRSSEIFDAYFDDPRSILSDVLLLLEPAQAKDETAVGAAYGPGLSQAARLLNEFIVAYVLAAGETTGGKPLRFFSRRRINELTQVCFGISTPEGHHVTDAEAMELLAVPRGGGTIAELVFPLHDLPAETVNLIGGAHQLHKAELFYEFELEARFSAAQDEPLRMLLMACIALEAAHSSFLRLRLQWRAPDLDSESAASDLLKDFGVYKIIRLTPALFMEPAERPPAALVEKAMKGIEARNAIMHAIRKKGKYKLRANYGDDALMGLGRSVLTLMRYFRAAVERDLAAAAPTTEGDADASGN